MTIKYTNIFHSMAIQNIPKIGIFGIQIYHLATQATHRIGVNVSFKIRLKRGRQRGL
jgi:hypothetical protein